MIMNDTASGDDIVPEGDAGSAARYYKRDFWSKENLKFSQPHYRLEKSARIIKRIAGTRECTLLDVGCGPATLMRVLPSNIQYYGIDMAIHEPEPNLMEADLVKNPIGFGDKQFDIVVAQGIFEYVGDQQSQKFSEIADILNPDGVFITSYWNFGHRGRQVYWAHNNVQPFADFRADLERHFKVNKCYPVCHNWHHSFPSRPLNKAVNRYLNVNIPFLSPMLAVEYFCICSPRSR